MSSYLDGKVVGFFMNSEVAVSVHSMTRKPVVENGIKEVYFNIKFEGLEAEKLKGKKIFLLNDYRLIMAFEYYLKNLGFNIEHSTTTKKRVENFRKNADFSKGLEWNGRNGNNYLCMKVK